MKTTFIKRINFWIAVYLTVSLITGLCVPVFAANNSGNESQRRVLKVAFPQVKGFTEKKKDGSRHGMVVDYLNEISKYTGWEYEYVDTTVEAAISEFMEGKYDLMGGNYYSSEFEKYFAYPDYNTGYSKAVLLARRDDQSIHNYDLESLNGKTIGVYDRAKENIRRLEEFLSINGLNCEIRTYSYEQLSDEGNLYNYLENGDVDLLLGNGLEDREPFHVVTSFDSQPYYIVTNVGNQEVLDGLNMALERILDSNPNFADECYDANFPDKKTVDIQINREEQEFIQKKGTVTVAVTDNWHPLFCPGTPEEPHNGLLPDILDKITDFSGLKFSYVHANTYAEAIRMVQEGEADIQGFFLDSEEIAGKQGLALSSAYVNANNIIMRNKASTYPDDGLTGAVVEGRELPGSVEAAEVKKYPSITDALSAVDKGEADFVYGLSARLEHDVQQYHFSNLVPVSLVNDQNDISFALKRPVEPELLTVLNKAINSLSAEEKNTILNRNLVSVGANNFSVKDFIYANPLAFIGVLAVILLVLVVAVLWITRARMQAAVMHGNLEKAKAESRAKGEFLSRMSHEIRTPMNAVVGLADLTGAMEEAPEAVKENLSKIRSSSHYLLDLINDILDMSQIDSGMLSIASESFSMDRLIDGVQSMMEFEAERRKLTYTIEKEITHSVLIGDAVRLRQVLTNLLSNAFKFTDEGGSVLLRVEEGSGTETDAVYTFRVIDSGKGISEEEQQRIFESFEQLGSNSSKSQGTGLGLPISRNIVRLMGGELNLKSEPGKGSEFFFTVTLPLGKQSEEQEESESIAANDLLDGVRILLAEDNDLNAEIAIQLLELQGAEVCRCENGKTALEQFSTSGPGEFRIILMDLQMPEMGGLEATRAIRMLDRPDAAAVPIVAMTANSFKSDVDAAIAAGMNGFISKPLDVNSMYSHLYNILKDSREDSGIVNGENR